MDAQTNQRKEEFAIGMGQLAKLTVMVDAQSKLRREESVGGMVCCIVN